MHKFKLISVDTGEEICKVGDTIKVNLPCSSVLLNQDTTTGTWDCPFEDVCGFEDCKDTQEQVFTTTIESIHCEYGNWTFYAKGLQEEFTVSDIGNRVQLVQVSDKGAVKDMDVFGTVFETIGYGVVEHNAKEPLIIEKGDYTPEEFSAYIKLFGVPENTKVIKVGCEIIEYFCEDDN